MSLVSIFRDAAWLSPERARAYGRLLLLGAVLLLAAVLGWLAYAGGSASDPFGRPIGTDFISFHAAADLALAGQPAAAYDMAAHRAAQQAIVPGLVAYYAFFYPPVFLLLILPLGGLPYVPALALWLGAGGLAYWQALRRLLPPPWAGWTILAFPAVLVTAGHGQNAFLTAALFGFAALWLDRRPALAGVCIGLLCFKPHLAVLAPVALAAGGRWRAFGAAGATVGVLVLASVVVLGPASWVAFLAQAPVARAALEMNAVGNEKMQSVFAAMRLLGGSLGVAYGVQAGVALVAAVAVAVLARRGASGFATGAALAAGAALTSPFLLDYDLLILAVPMAYVVSRPGGFLPWEKSVLAAAFILPIVARPIAGSLGLPLAPVVTALLFAVVWRRGWREAGDGQATLGSIRASSQKAM